MFTEDYSVTSYLSSFKDHLFSLVSTTLKIVIFCFWNKLFSRYCPNQGVGEGGSQVSQNVQTQYVQIRGGGRGGFNLLDNVPNLGVFFLKASLKDFKFAFGDKNTKLYVRLTKIEYMNFFYCQKWMLETLYNISKLSPVHCYFRLRQTEMRLDFCYMNLVSPISNNK